MEIFPPKEICVPLHFTSHNSRCLSYSRARRGGGEEDDEAADNAVTVLSNWEVAVAVACLVSQLIPPARLLNGQVA